MITHVMTRTIIKSHSNPTATGCARTAITFNKFEKHLIDKPLWPRKDAEFSTTNGQQMRVWN
jgi:hypothetical protein